MFFSNNSSFKGKTTRFRISLKLSKFASTIHLSALFTIKTVVNLNKQFNKFFFCENLNDFEIVSRFYFNEAFINHQSEISKNIVNNIGLNFLETP